MEKITITLPVCDQIGPDDFMIKHCSKVFEKSASINEIEAWIKGRSRSSNITDVIISSLDE